MEPLPRPRELDIALSALIVFYERISPENLVLLGDLYAPDARFKDPFNDVRGVAAIERIFRHMFENTDAPRFFVNTSVLQDRQAMLGWRFQFGSRFGVIEIQGVTHLEFDPGAKVILHRDYWDAAEELYAKLPVIGAGVRWLSRRFAAAP